ncbi:MAG TPA: hypothetical protein PKD37_06680 [Oligoflexia bacterium]|nr:hypothetical protein [Oligoflexia bacterium]HMP27647.1 hypothetical protein [Oligoflexia bacterium]
MRANNNISGDKLKTALGIFTFEALKARHAFYQAGKILASEKLKLANFEKILSSLKASFKKLKPEQGSKLFEASLERALNSKQQHQSALLAYNDALEKLNILNIEQKKNQEKLSLIEGELQVHKQQREEYKLEETMELLVAEKEISSQKSPPTIEHKVETTERLTEADNKISHTLTSDFTDNDRDSNNQQNNQRQIKALQIWANNEGQGIDFEYRDSQDIRYKLQFAEKNEDGVVILINAPKQTTSIKNGLIQELNKDLQNAGIVVSKLVVK